MGKGILISGLEHSSGSTKMYKNTFGAHLIHLPSLSNYQCTNIVYNFGWPLNTGSSVLQQVQTYCNARKRKIYATFTRLRDNFEFRDHVPSHNPSSTVCALVHAFWHSSMLSWFSYFYCHETFHNRRFKSKGTNKTGFMEYEWQTWINSIVTIYDFLLQLDWNTLSRQRKHDAGLVMQQCIGSILITHDHEQALLYLNIRGLLNIKK